MEALHALREIQRLDPERWSKICRRTTYDSSTNETKDDQAMEDEDPFADSHDFDDDCVVTVSELVQSIAANIEGLALTSHLVVAPEGHVTLLDDQEVKTDRPEATPELGVLSIDDVIKAVQDQGTGRGKRRRIKSSRYDKDFEGH